MRIGVFDSGIGGITVLDAIRRAYPENEYVYLGDNAHVPYGGKSPSQIEILATRAASLLQKKGVEAIIVACNTASSWALSAIEMQVHPIPVMGVITPGVKAVEKAWHELRKNTKEGLPPILVLATRATIQSHVYRGLLSDRLTQGAFTSSDLQIFEQECSLLVPIIEEGWTQHPILDQVLEEYLKPYAKVSRPGVALLGCTHYPWIRSHICRILKTWEVVDSAAAVVQEMKSNPLFNRKGKGNSAGRSEVDWIFTDSTSAAPSLFQNYFKCSSFFNS